MAVEAGASLTHSRIGAVLLTPSDGHGVALTFFGIGACRVEDVSR